MNLPGWLEIEQSENTAFAMHRNLRGLSGSWGEMLAEAQTVMSFFQDWPESDLPLLYDQPAALPLIAAARILDSASKRPSTLEDEERIYAGFTAAVAYSMYGNFASSRATVRRVLKELPSITADHAILIATISPGSLPDMLPRVAGSKYHLRYLELLNKYYTTGIASDFNSTVASYDHCVSNAATPFDRSLFLSGRISLLHAGNLAVARVFQDTTLRISSPYVRALLDAEYRVLLPPQYTAVVKYGLTRRKDNALVVLPPSTGKTLLGALVALLRSPARN